MIGCVLRDHSDGEGRTFPEPSGMGLLAEAKTVAWLEILLQDLWVLLSLGRRGFNHYFSTGLRGEGRFMEV